MAPCELDLPLWLREYNPICLALRPARVQGDARRPLPQVPREDEGTVKKYYRPAEVAQMLEISERTMRRLMARGDIRYNKVGGQVRFSEHQVSNYQKKTEV